MSLDISFTDDWADGTYTFRLGVKELDELQDITGVGVERLHWLMANPNAALRDYKTKWARATVRLALIGGGTEPKKAEQLCRMYVDDRPIREYIMVAIAALGGVIVGIDNAIKGKKKAKRTQTTTAQDASTSPPSTEQLSPSASAPPGTESLSAS